MAEFDVPFTPPTYDVHRLAQESASDEECVISVKLTDECLTAIAAAHKRKTRLKLVVDEQGGGSVLIGDSLFRFSTQSLPTPFADAVSCRPGVGFKAKASVPLKYTIQATQNSFEETRVKAQKLMEEEKSRGTKDVNKSRNGKKTEVGRGLSGAHSAAALAHARQSSLGVNKSIANERLGGSTNTSRNASPIMNPAAASAAAAAQVRMTPSMKADLMKKTLRERVIHICATARYHTYDEVVARLRKDGLPMEQDARSLIEAVLREVSDFSESKRVVLKPSLFSEVNLKWQWLSTEEKQFIRRMLNPNHSNSSSAFAPIRKSGVDRVMAPGATVNAAASSLNTSTTSSSSSSDRMREKDLSRVSGFSSSSNTSSPEAVADRSPLPARAALPSGGGAKKRPPSPLVPEGITKETAAVGGVSSGGGGVEEEEELYYTTPPSSKRKAHAPSAALSHHSSKTTSPTMERVPSSLSSSSSLRPVRLESASPPEDPTMAKEELRGKASKMTSVSPRPPPPQLQPQQQQLAARDLAPPTSATTTSSSGSSGSAGSAYRPRQSSLSRAPSTSPRTDWTVVYGAIGNAGDAETYTLAFTDSYAEYAEAHAKLSKIADEFTAMERELTACARGSREADQVETKIQSKYAYYEKDLDFIKLRNRHGDLRSKLTTIRSRLDSWESRRL